MMSTMPERATTTTSGLGVRRDGWWWRLGLYALLNAIAGYVALVVVVPVVFAITDVDSLDDAIELGGVVLGGLAAPLGLGGGSVEPGPLIVAAVVSAVVTGLQAIFLLPLFRPPAVGGRARSIVASALAASLMVAALLGGIAWAILETITYSNDAIEAVSPFAFWLTPIVALVPSWIVWSRFLLRRSDRSASMALDLMLGPLWLGSAASIAVIVPLDAMTRRQKDCYCATGGFFAICLSICGILFLLGPTILLLATRRNRRRIRTRGCRVCGYRRIRGAGPRCPECGHAWIGCDASGRAAA